MVLTQRPLLPPCANAAVSLDSSGRLSEWVQSEPQEGAAFHRWCCGFPFLRVGLSPAPTPWERWARVWSSLRERRLRSGERRSGLGRQQGGEQHPAPTVRPSDPSAVVPVPRPGCPPATAPPARAALPDPERSACLRPRSQTLAHRRAPAPSHCAHGAACARVSAPSLPCIRTHRPPRAAADRALSLPLQP